MNKRLQRIRRHKRIRAKVIGTATRPRLSVFRSNKHLHVQLIDDGTGKTLVYASRAKELAEKAAAAGIKQVVFDRGGFKYHGQIAKLADALRAAGLKF